MLNLLYTVSGVLRGSTISCPSHPPFFVFLPGARPGARLVVAMHCVHNNALRIGAGAGQDILPRHFIIMTIVVLGSPRIPG